MGLIDDVRQRRHQKIRSLLDEYNNLSPESEAIKKQSNEDDFHSKKKTSLTFEDEFPYHSIIDLEKIPLPPPSFSAVDGLDPELSWKRNPNPWAAWDEEKAHTNSPRSFVKSAPLYNERSDPPKNGRGRFQKEMTWKLVISALLFGGVWAMFQYNHEWTAKGQTFVKQALTDEIDFASAALWYREVFDGAPSFIPIFGEESGDATLVDGTIKSSVISPLADASIIRSFADLLSGVELAGASQAEVAAVETGRVIQVTAEQDRVLIQHANSRITIYGKLASTNVAVNDWVEAGDTIGHLPKSKAGEHSLLYFAIKQNDRYLDPVDVIPID
ncbi:M23 family metallopeptidase [Paenibacillus sp. L3-i20]|uniref:M23 family metallopeptidase n=1 Tax=Paenibacillus sp. L3-i20 TaxID=2905833 RepID=UPI001EDE79F5|nr:M23 family metallopeptidase [Paenibacillus sp. L3-i20]GKU75715.1 hypothetical protein L3i20_v201120 [Paenibacillus sp. L3-i20]